MRKACGRCSVVYRVLQLLISQPHVLVPGSIVCSLPSTMSLLLQDVLRSHTTTDSTNRDDSDDELVNVVRLIPFFSPLVTHSLSI
jgi:hypothetical protein